MKKIRLAAIDIGTNSIRCIIVELDNKGRYTVIDDEKAAVRLGESLSKTGKISAAACGRALEAIGRMKQLIDGLKVTEVEAIATSAMRNALNGSELVDELSKILGKQIRVISGVEEAELAAASAFHNFEMSNSRYAMIDIGGGSVEVVIAMGNHIEVCHSIDIGAVLMTERFLSSDPIAEADYKALQRHVRHVLKTCFAEEKINVQSVIGSGGTITSLGAIVMNNRRESFSSVHGYELLRSEVVHQLSMLMRMDVKSRRNVAGLNPDRADIVVAGIVVVDELMKFFNANLIRINERGIREGLILTCIKRLGLSQESVKMSWRRSVMEFVQSCHCDELHSRHVAKLCLAIFDGIASDAGLGKLERKILEAAALMHDIGYLISYNSHHKHSYHLIRHADLFGFSPRERELVAQIARYHRKSFPKKKHVEYSRLEEKDQILIGRLAGILRLADGLDRRRGGFVEIVDVCKTDNLCKIGLLGTEDISVELFGANSKRELFEVKFGCDVMISIS